jgi:2-polyprenyl-3-methyl-5-hydroxy-6-metoxy-1,4-benzoquinol methylase
MPRDNITHVTDDQNELYGKNYYLSRLPEKYGYVDFETRARTDLPERCLHWLRSLLRYKLPPAKVLELGSAHGGFVAILRWAGFNACGLELSPWIVDFARKTFEVPMFLGPLEDHELDPNSFDAIALMDVLEHIVDPVDLIQRCLAVLKSDGILIIQTPDFPENKSYDMLKKENNPFLEQLKDEEHLFLFSRNAITKFFRQLGIEFVAFEQPIFAHYDMFFVASSAFPTIQSQETAEKTLMATPSGRIVQAMLDLDDEIKGLQKKYSALNMDFQICEADRAARLQLINEQGSRLGELEAERNNLRSQLGELEVERNNLRSQGEALSRSIQIMEAERERMIRSFSFRITAPLRWVRRKVFGLIQWVRS